MQSLPILTLTVSLWPFQHADNPVTEPRPGLVTRASSNCTSGTFTASVGLTFQVNCNADFDKGYQDTTSKIFSSVDECINGCAYTKQCYAALFNDSSGDCSYYNGLPIGIQGELQSTTGVHVAFVDPSEQLTNGFDTKCPYTNGSSQAINGVEFTIYCGLDEVGYNDYCPTDGPLNPNGPTTACPVHVDSLSDCMEFCTNSHPLCAGVSWNPDLGSGYGNCYPKNGPPNNGFGVAQGNDSTGEKQWAHTAVANIANGSSITVDCTNQAKIFAANGAGFITSCNVSMADNNITITHQDSLQNCIDSCAAWDDGSCVGVEHDTQLTKGWANCYLKNATAPMQVATGTDSTVALLSSTNGTSENSPSGESGGSSTSKGTIAGAVIGGVAGLLLLVAAWWWIRRREMRRQAAKAIALDQGYYGAFGKAELDAKENRSAPVEMDSVKVRAEMDAVKARAEMDAVKARAEMEASIPPAEMRASNPPVELDGREQSDMSE